VRRGAGAFLLIAGLSACSNPIPGNPTGPYASPTPGPAQAVIIRGCANGSHEGPEATDVGFVKSSLIRQDAALGRVGDDITGAVPGGNFPVDTALARANAQDIADLVSRSTLCSPFKEKLAAAAKALVAADTTLAGTTADSAQVTLDQARAAFIALQGIANNPPSPATSPSP
jgi:hypothetical protein